MAANNPEYRVPLKLLVDEKKNKVIAAEANRDFVDILFSFLTFPIGTVIRLTNGSTVSTCMNNLYRSVENLDDKHLYSEHCKSILLNPRNPCMEDCFKLKVNIDDSVTNKYFKCSNEGCSSKSWLLNIKCCCGGRTTKEIFSDITDPTDYSGAFLRGGIEFIVSDDLRVLPSSSSLIQLLSDLGYSHMDQIKEMSVEVGKEEEFATSVESSPINCFEMENKQESKVQLKLLVDEKKEQVVAAEAKVDFMNILVSLLTLPMGTIIRLIKADAGVVGCMNNLYQSVENLREEDLFIEHCKTMLLNPRNPYPKYCRRLKVNVDDSGPVKYYRCPACSKACFFTNIACSCGGTIKEEKIWKDIDEKTCRNEYGFIKGGISFLITDDLQVKSSSPSSLVQMLSDVGLSDTNQIKEIDVEVGKNEVIHLLARSFISKTSLSDVFLPKQKRKRARVDTITMSEPGNLSSISENGTSNNTKKLELKLTLRKSTNKVLCAEAGNEFIDFLFNFLTFPLGSIEDALKGSSGLGCIDNFYRSVETLDSKWFNMPKRNRYKSGDTNDNLKTIVLKPCIATYHKSESQLLQIPEGKEEIYCLYDPRENVKGTRHSNFRKFVKVPSLFYILDNLEVRPLSSTSTIHLLQELNVPINDIEEQIISVGESEALSLLKASLTSSSSALTEGLNHKLKQLKNEDTCNLKKLSRAG